MLGALLDPVRTQKKNCLYGVVSGCNSLHGSFLMKFLCVSIKQQKEAALPAVL